MKSSKVAIRYAQALLELAIENNTLESVSRDMTYLSTVNNENRDFQLLLSSPIIKADKKIAVLNEIFGAFETVSTAFIALIAKNGRESILPEIAEAFHELVKEKKGIVKHFLPVHTYNRNLPDPRNFHSPLYIISIFRSTILSRLRDY
ncbi:MAG: ATP synthase F1 subunit delta [Flavobacteriia bacterium]|nr:ATP synthase F1 subunit delta [Flavobacteriia bacterium]